jgi:hypothetical protein
MHLGKLLINYYFTADPDENFVLSVSCLMFEANSDQSNER